MTVTVNVLARWLWEAYQKGRYFGNPYEEYWPEDRPEFEEWARRLMRERDDTIRISGRHQ